MLGKLTTGEHPFNRFATYKLDEVIDKIVNEEVCYPKFLSMESIEIMKRVSVLFNLSSLISTEGMSCVLSNHFKQEDRLLL